MDIHSCAALPFAEEDFDFQLLAIVAEKLGKDIGDVTVEDVKQYAVTSGGDNILTRFGQ